jgi:ribosomal protein S6
MYAFDDGVHQHVPYWEERVLLYRVAELRAGLFELVNVARERRLAKKGR